MSLKPIFLVVEGEEKSERPRFFAGSLLDWWVRRQSLRQCLLVRRGLLVRRCEINGFDGVRLVASTFEGVLEVGVLEESLYLKKACISTLGVEESSISWENSL